MVGETRNPLRPYSIACSKSFLNGSLPNFACSSTQAETQPGTVTVSQPRTGIALLPAKYSSVQAAGDPYAVFAGGLTRLARDEFTAAAAELKRGMEINRVNAALNADMKRVLERIEEHLSGDAPPPQSGNGVQPGQFLLSAYTKTLN